jgi:hypothetical protein
MPIPVSNETDATECAETATTGKQNSTTKRVGRGQVGLFSSERRQRDLASLPLPDQQHALRRYNDVHSQVRSSQTRLVLGMVLFLMSMCHDLCLQRYFTINAFHIDHTQTGMLRYNCRIDWSPVLDSIKTDPGSAPAVYLEQARGLWSSDVAAAHASLTSLQTSGNDALKSLTRFTRVRLINFALSSMYQVPTWVGFAMMCERIQKPEQTR